MWETKTHHHHQVNSSFFFFFMFHHDIFTVVFDTFSLLLFHKRSFMVWCFALRRVIKYAWYAFGIYMKWYYVTAFIIYVSFTIFLLFLETCKTSGRKETVRNHPFWLASNYSFLPLQGKSLKWQNVITKLESHWVTLKVSFERTPRITIS